MFGKALEREAPATLGSLPDMEENDMRKLILAFAALAAVVPQSGALAVEYQDKHLVDLHTWHATNCVLFRLEGVSVADAAISPHPWIALRKDHAQFGEIYAMLLTAKAGRLLIDVFTGAGVCGHPSVDLVTIN